MNIKKAGLIASLTAAVFGLCFAQQVFSKVGVGVNTGAITVDEDLKPGMVYQLPNLTIINTGDVGSDYQADVAYREGEDALRPPKEWFEFSPQEFYLGNGESQSVNIILRIPLNAEPGEYFAFLQGKPVVRQEGGATIGVAAAAKLNFTIVPANVLAAVYYRGLFFWRDFYPWTLIISAVVGGSVLVVTLKRLLGIDIDVKMGGKSKKGKKSSNE